jgi:flagellar biosynthesis protein FlhG
VKPLAELDHYETLEIPPTSSAADVERAYVLARSTYTAGSLAGHSVFEDGDVELMQERIELAYRTLSEPAAREAYDAELARKAQARAPVVAADPAHEQPSPPPQPAVRAAALELDDLDDALDGGEFDGSRLRRARLRQGLDLEGIASVTKVNPMYLGFIEEERFEALPAAVYVRGFVMGYARCVGLDAAAVARSYMRRYEQRNDGSKRKRFSRR